MSLIMILILLYQVTMPGVDNAKYTVIEHNNQLIRMNTQDGSFEPCDENLKCKSK